MLTQVVGNRVYDFSHTVGRRDLAMVTGVVTGNNDIVYLLSRPTEMDPDAPCDRIGKMSQIGKYYIGTDWGSEELIKEYAEFAPFDKDTTDYTDTVYPYVPVSVVDKVLKKHGGINLTQTLLEAE